VSRASGSWLPALLAVGVLSAGCTLIPRYQRPAAPVRSTFPIVSSPTGAAPGAHAAAASGAMAADIAVRDFFVDERLKRLIEIALANNRDLRIAVLNVEQSRAQYRISRSALLPNVQGDASFTRQRAPIASGLPAGFDGGALTSTSSIWSASVGVASYQLDLFGHVRAENAQALEQYFATAEARRAAQVTLVGEVATQYFTLRQAQEQLSLAHDTLTVVQASYQLNLATFNAGQSNELDLRQAESQVETAQLSIETYERQIVEAQDALELLLGAPLPADLPPRLPLGANMMVDIPVGLPSDLLAQRPDILEAEHSLEAANANIGVARAAFFPSISLTSSAGFSSSALSSLFTGGAGAWSFAPQISVPIFTAGRLRAQLNSAVVGERVQVATYEKAIQTAFREVSDALIDIETYARQISTETALITTQRRRFELATLRYRQGEDSYLNVLTAQQDLYSAQQGLLLAQLDKLTSQVSLYQALGGGWK
jgi:multidrug efflux system outer membrane protein